MRTGGDSRQLTVMDFAIPLYTSLDNREVEVSPLLSLALDLTKVPVLSQWLT